MQVAYIDIVNAYPSYECTVTLQLTNTGSIPFNVIGSELNIFGDAPIETLENSCEFDLEDPQVDPGEEKELSCTVHVMQEAEQNECTGTTAQGAFPVVTHDCTNEPLVSYSFAIDVCVAQWNEAATFEACKGSEQHEGPPSSR
jgi:hypothetical protein